MNGILTRALSVAAMAAGLGTAGVSAGDGIRKSRRSRSKITLGLNYIGLLDELAMVTRALRAAEVAALYRLDRGVASLGR